MSRLPHVQPTPARFDTETYMEQHYDFFVHVYNRAVEWAQNYEYTGPIKLSYQKEINNKLIDRNLTLPQGSSVRIRRNSLVDCSTGKLVETPHATIIGGFAIQALFKYAREQGIKTPSVRTTDIDAVFGLQLLIGGKSYIDEEYAVEDLVKHGILDDTNCFGLHYANFDDIRRHIMHSLCQYLPIMPVGVRAIAEKDRVSIELDATGDHLMELIVPDYLSNAFYHEMGVKINCVVCNGLQLTPFKDLISQQNRSVTARGGTNRLDVLRSNKGISDTASLVLADVYRTLGEHAIARHVQSVDDSLLYKVENVRKRIHQLWTINKKAYEQGKLTHFTFDPNSFAGQRLYKQLQTASSKSTKALRRASYRAAPSIVLKF